MRGYTQLIQEERYQIYILIKAGHAQSEIAEMLAHHKSTISRELRRNHGLKGYRSKQAHRLAAEPPAGTYFAVAGCGPLRVPFLLHWPRFRECDPLPRARA